MKCTAYVSSITICAAESGGRDFIMKKIIIVALVLSIIAASFIGCDAKAGQFKGQWSFSKISKVELGADVQESQIADLMEEYGAEDKKGIEEGALAAFTADGTFDPCYLNFDKKYTYTYDPTMDREATWVFYKTGENEGFISFYTDLNAADGNPDPRSNPTIVYNAENDTMLMTLTYMSFTVTVELTK